MNERALRVAPGAKGPFVQCIKGGNWVKAQYCEQKTGGNESQCNRDERLHKQANRADIRTLFDPIV